MLANQLLATVAQPPCTLRQYMNSYKTSLPFSVPVPTLPNLHLFCIRALNALISFNCRDQLTWALQPHPLPMAPGAMVRLSLPVLARAMLHCSRAGSIVTTGPSWKPHLTATEQKERGSSMRLWLQTATSQAVNSYLPDQDSVLQCLIRSGVVTVTVCWQSSIARPLVISEANPGNTARK